MALYTMKERYGFVTPAQTQVYNMLGRDTGLSTTQNQGYNPLQSFADNIVRKAKSAENALGTTGASIIAGINDTRENRLIGERNNRFAQNMADIYKSAGFNNADEYYNAKDAEEDALYAKYGFNNQDYWNKRAEADDTTKAQLDAERSAIKNSMDAGDRAIADKWDNYQQRLINQSAANYDEAKQAADNWRDYRENDYISKKINQDNTKFLGSAVNTLSTAYDLASMAAGIPNGPITNALQGAIEGYAGELEQNGGNVDLTRLLERGVETSNWDNFDAGRAGQSALIGGVSGLATGALNKALPKSAAKTALGNVWSGTWRGAASGALGGAVGGGLGAGLNNAFNGGNQDVAQAALQGALQGAGTGAVSGGIMSATNQAGGALARKVKIGDDRTLADKLHENTQTWKNWKKSGENFNERLTNTLNSGESAVGNWINGKQSKVLGTLGNVGNRIQDVSDQPQFDADELATMIREARKNGLTSQDLLAMAEAYEFDSDGNVKAADIMKLANRPDGRELVGPGQGRAYNKATKDWQDTPTLQQISEYGYDPADVTGDPTTITADGRTYYKIGENKWATRGGNGRGDLGGRYRDDQIAEIVANANDVNVNPKQVATDNRVLTATGTDEQYTFASNDNAPRNVKQAAVDYAYETDGRVDPAELTDFYNQTRNVPNTDVEGMAMAIQAETDGRVDANELLDFVRAQDGATYGSTKAINFKGEETPTTAGGWVKKAGKRLAEDISKTNLGNRIQDVSDDQAFADSGKPWQDSVRQQALNDYYAEQLNGTSNGDEVLLRNARQALMEADPDYYAKTSPNDDANFAQMYDRVAQKLQNVQTRGDVRDILLKNDIDPTDVDYLLGATQYADDMVLDETDTRLYNQNRLSRMKNSNYSDDINNMFVNRNDMLDTATESPETELYRQLTGTSERAMQSTPVSTGDAWDNLAREYGFNTYNDAIRAFAAANPNTPISAGAVTTWLDSNGGTYNPNARQVTPIQEAEIVAEENPLERAFDNNAGTIQKRNKLQELGQIVKTAGESTKYGGVYDSMDAKTAYKAAKNNAPQKLAELDVKPRDYGEYAKTSSYVNNVVSKLAEDSNVKVSLPDLPNELAYENIEPVLSDAYKKKYDGYVQQIAADGKNPDEYSAGYLLKESRRFGDLAAKVPDEPGDQQQYKDALNNVKYTLRAAAAEALDKYGITGEDTNELIAQGLRNMGANEKVVNHYTQLKDGKAPKLGDYIYRSSTFEEARNMGRSIKANQYKRSASTRPTNISGRIWRAIGGEQVIEPLLENTVSPIAGKITSGVGTAIAKTGDAAQKVNNLAATPTSNNLYNIIGREEGVSYTGNENADNYLETAALDAQAGYVAPLAATTSTAGATGVTTPTSVYDTLTGTTTNAQTPIQSRSRYAGLFSNTGDGQVDLIGRAMELAMEDDDAAAFGALYSMYSDAMGKLQSANSTTNLSATQQNQLAKLQSASDAIDELEDLFNGATGGKGPIAGNLQGWAGVIGLDNGAATYNDSREGIAATIAQALGGSRTEGTTKRISAMLPQLTDSEETANTKIQTLRNLLAQQANNYSSAYGLTSEY